MEVSMEWPSMVISLEPLRPLSPEILNDKQINIATDVDKLSRSELAGKLLDHFDELHQEESEPFDWFSSEKSIDIPFFESIRSSSLLYKMDMKQLNSNFSTTAEEFELSSSSFSVYDSIHSPVMYSSSSSLKFDEPSIHVESIKNECCPSALKCETLTPPCSPKNDILKLLEKLEPETLEQLVVTPADEFNSSTHFKMNSGNLIKVDSDECGSHRTPSPGLSNSDLDDPEWTPPSNVRQQKCNNSSIKNSNRDYNVKCNGKNSSIRDSGSFRRGTSKPYSKPGTEERKQRKKEQNKDAATRYRLKKKTEMEEFKTEESRLLKRNIALRQQLEELNREIGYLKSLMRDVYRKKGAIN